MNQAALYCVVFVFLLIFHCCCPICFKVTLNGGEAVHLFLNILMLFNGRKNEDSLELKSSGQKKRGTPPGGVHP